MNRAAPHARGQSVSGMKTGELMVKIYKTLLWVLAASACIVILSIRPQAAEYKMGPGDSYAADGSIVSLNGTKVVDSEGNILTDAFSRNETGYTVIGNGSGSSNAVSEILNDVSDRTISKAPIVIGSTQSSTAAVTKTGEAVSKQTADVSSDAYSVDGVEYRKSSLYGTRRLTGYAEEESGTAETVSGRTAKSGHTVAVPSDIPLGTVIIVEGTDGPYASRYNGAYVVEDRGGAVLESEGFIDIFFDSAAEAEAVTAGGWNYAKIWIAEAVQ